ncbi:MAG: DsbA family protein [Janthinobacterium lividum]
MSRWTPYLGALCGVALGAGAVAWWQGDAETAGRQRTEAIVHGYLLDHPEVIAEATQRLQDRDTGRQVAASRPAIETPVGSAWAGNPRGDVSVIEYFDYNCGFCRASLPTVRQLIAAEPGVRIVYRDLPVLAQSSLVAARASLLAARQGRFARFHDALYAAGPVSDATIAAAERIAGVDTGKAAADQPAEDAQLRANLDVARRLGMAGTPSWVIGDRVLIGAQTLDQLRAAVAAARAARGTAA